MGADEMSELPPGFVLDAPAGQPALPPGFVVDGPPERGVVDKLLGSTGPRYQLWPERAVRGMLELPEKAITAAASAPAGSRDATEAMVAPAAEAAIATLGSMGGLRAGLPKPAVPTTQALKDAAGAGYDAARATGVQIAPEAVTRMADTTAAALEKDGINAKLAPKTFSIIGELKTPPPGGFATVDNFETIRRTLGNAARDFNNPTEQMAASRAIRMLDDHLASIGTPDVIAGDATKAASALAGARGDYAAAKRAEQIGDAGEAADLSAAAANSGRNIGNQNRQKFKSILLSDKEIAGYSPQELAQLEQIIRGTKTGNTARYIGNLLGGGGGLGQVVTSGIGAGVGSAGGPVGAAIGAAVPPVVGNIARMLSNSSTAKQVAKLDEMVRKRSPLYKNQGAETGGGTPPFGVILEALMQQQGSR